MAVNAGSFHSDDKVTRCNKYFLQGFNIGEVNVSNTDYAENTVSMPGKEKWRKS